MWRFSRNDCVPEIWRENKRKSLRERSIAHARMWVVCRNERSMAHARMCVIPFAGEHAHLLDATDKVPPRVLHFSAFHYYQLVLHWQSDSRLLLSNVGSSTRSYARMELLMSGPALPYDPSSLASIPSRGQQNKRVLTLLGKPQWH